MKDQFRQIHPDAFYLDAAERSDLRAHLRGLGWLGADEALLSATPIGDDTMNMVVRVETPTRSLVLKQSRPWMESLPEIPAPFDRALVEARFLEVTQPDAMLAEMQPALLGVDRASRLIAMGDLGPLKSFYDVYSGARLTQDEAFGLMDYLSALHALEVADEPLLANRAMRELTHEHTFTLPLRPGNGLHLDMFTEGLAAEAKRLRNNDDFTARTSALGQAYLDDGPSLLHGEFYPGSWARMGEALFILDMECAFKGPPEYDLGVMLAHLLITRQPSPGELMALYDGPRAVDEELMMGFAGVEITRRLLGVSPLPMSASLSAQRLLLAIAQELLLRPSRELIA